MRISKTERKVNAQCVCVLMPEWNCVCSYVLHVLICCCVLTCEWQQLVVRFGAAAPWVFFLTRNTCFTCVPVSVNYSLMEAAVGCWNIWITVSVFCQSIWVYLATQVYILIDDVLGDRPSTKPSNVIEPRTPHHLLCPPQHQTNHLKMAGNVTGEHAIPDLLWAHSPNHPHPSPLTLA